MSARRLTAVGFAATAAAAIAALAAAAAADSSAGTPRRPVTLGSVTGNPTGNICTVGIKCTYVPFTSVSAPALQVPFDGTVTRFQVNAGSAGGTVWLRVLRPAGGGQYTGVGTSAPQTLALGINTFTVSLPVKTGDLIALDNDSSALMFDTSSATPISAYYELPALADGATSAPNRTQDGYRLLLSATVTPTTPALSHVRESHRVWRESGARTSGKIPVGTRFSFTLNEAVHVTFAFRHRTTGRVVGAIKAHARAGLNRLSFQGRIKKETLAPGRYTVALRATDGSGNRSKSVTLRFTIARP